MSVNACNNTESRREDWGTPQPMFDSLHEIFDFKVDLCASKENTKTQLYVSEEMDLLQTDCFLVDTFVSYSSYMWINPPYKSHGGTGKYVGRAVEIAGTRGLACLIPVSVGSLWWGRHVWPHFDIFIFPRRFPFAGAGDKAKFDCAICIRKAQSDHNFKEKTIKLKALKLGQIVERI